MEIEEIKNFINETKKELGEIQKINNNLRRTKDKDQKRVLLQQKWSIEATIKSQVNKAEKNFREMLKEIVKEIIEGGDSEKLVIISEELGIILKEHNVTNTKIRNIFEYAKGIHVAIKMNTDKKLTPQEITKINLLSPKIAYIKSREKGNTAQTLETLKMLFDECIASINKNPEKEKFQRFMDMFEATLAYHKYYGGKN